VIQDRSSVLFVESELEHGGGLFDKKHGKDLADVPGKGVVDFAFEVTKEAVDQRLDFLFVDLLDLSFFPDDLFLLGSFFRRFCLLLGCLFLLFFLRSLFDLGFLGLLNRLRFFGVRVFWGVRIGVQILLDDGLFGFLSWLGLILLLFGFFFLLGGFIIDFDLNLFFLVVDFVYKERSVGEEVLYGDVVL